eukprot:CAMPEP_0171217826 /NCGR_PEP_ID=MMETSP0790-20130122/32889_1 /TAXON_ID=2925 /ORGANISM="Alexandrium catenella, Strain OF101" /LENGTH=345 /DNA_ID=CAMNT_0011683635 /DNA_START=12 /DNA_END=1045 /DNA_ORIENTATION=+
MAASGGFIPILSVPLETGPDVLRVTTFNLLAPVWTHQSIYPGMDMAEFEPTRRRQTQVEVLQRLDPDVVFMQECQKTELDALLELDDGVIQNKYDVEFCPFPLTFWTNWLTEATDFEPRENGVCVLTKKSAVTKLEAQHLPIDLPEWKDQLPQSSLGAHACLVTVEIPRWGGAKVLLATSHLDADSAHRAGLQGRELAKQLLNIGSIDCFIWGGDFNMEYRNPTLKEIERMGFTRASGDVKTPTVYACMGCVRVDHIFCAVAPRGGRVAALESLATYVPTCPMGHTISVVPFLSELQWLACSAMGQRGRCLQVLTVLCMIVFFPLVLLLFTPVFILACGRRKQRA